MAASNRPDLATLLAQADHFIEPLNGGPVPTIDPNVTFCRDDAYETIGAHMYSRYSSPTVRQAETLLTALDNGADGKLFATGLAAIAALIDTVPEGGHVVAPEIMYFGAQAWLKRRAARGSLRLTLFDQTDPDGLAQAVVPGDTDLVWIETPANPTWDVIDIERSAAIAHEAGAILGIDSTVAPAVTTRPLDLGADIVFHSATKYLNGHSDLTAGLLVTSEVNERWHDVGLVRQNSGGTLGAFEAWLLIRGLRTLDVRYQRASASALSIATHFEGHPNVERVAYPGLESHPGHEIAKRQMTGGFSGMLSLLVRGDFEATKRVATGLSRFLPATSLGGVESLVEHRKAIEGPESIVPDNLLRLSLGLEAVDDLIDDVEQALARV